MVAISNDLFEAELREPRQDRGGGLQRMADVLEELFQRFPLPPLEDERRKVEEPATA